MRPARRHRERIVDRDEAIVLNHQLNALIAMRKSPIDWRRVDVHIEAIYRINERRSRSGLVAIF
jgi:hypothetical protein